MSFATSLNDQPASMISDVRYGPDCGLTADSMES